MPSAEGLDKFRAAPCAALDENSLIRPAVCSMIVHITPPAEFVPGEATFKEDGAPTYRLETLDDWIARVKARGHTMLEEKQLKFHIERYGNIAHLWSSYALYSDGKQVARGINSIQAIKEAGGWRAFAVSLMLSRATQA